MCQGRSLRVRFRTGFIPLLRNSEICDQHLARWLASPILFILCWMWFFGIFCIILVFYGQLYIPNQYISEDQDLCLVTLSKCSWSIIIIIIIISWSIIIIIIISWSSVSTNQSRREIIHPMEKTDSQLVLRFWGLLRFTFHTNNNKWLMPRWDLSSGITVILLLLDNKRAISCQHEPNDQTLGELWVDEANLWILPSHSCLYLWWRGW